MYYSRKTVISGLGLYDLKFVSFNSILHSILICFMMMSYIGYYASSIFISYGKYGMMYKMFYTSFGLYLMNTTILFLIYLSLFSLGTYLVNMMSLNLQKFGYMMNENSIFNSFLLQMIVLIMYVYLLIMYL